MGKTSLAMNIATNVANDGGKVVVFSLEMSRGEITTRMMSTLARVSMPAISTGSLTSDEFTTLRKSVEKIDAMDIHLDDSSSPSVRDIRSRVFKLRRKTGSVDLLVIDYLQLMDAEGENRNDALSKISRQLKILAKDLKIPIVLLSQLNRNLESRNNKRPILSDLRDSGAIEQDADVVMFVYRDEVYYDESEDKGTAEIIDREKQKWTCRFLSSGIYWRIHEIWRPWRIIKWHL